MSQTEEMQRDAISAGTEEADLLPNIHPGEILREEFLEPMGIAPERLAKGIGVGRMRVSEILQGRRGITPDTAIRLGLYFGVTPQFWLNLQARYNLVEARRANQEEYRGIIKWTDTAA